MKYIETPFKESYLIELNSMGDERGFFSRLFCAQEFEDRGLERKVVQINDSYSQSKHTLRGMHYQIAPMEETKLVRCIKGAIWDVILDIRPDSPTFGHSFGAELTADNRRMLYVPRGFAHGFLTLEEESEIIYFVSQCYSKEHERGIRWNDPAFNIQWPHEPEVISERDRCHPDFDGAIELAQSRG